MKRKIIISLLIFLTFNISNVCAYDDSKTHPEITRVAVLSSTLDAYLKNNLNLADGVNTLLQSDGQKFVFGLLMDGSFVEDDLDICRASNHFHDPLKTWSTSGMSDEPLWADAVCFFWKPFYSDVTWATGFTDPTGTPIPYNPNSEKSPNMWANARSLYLSALTATNQNTRENNFAQMFKALGQVLHLLQDMSVPAHVRNDFESHLTYSGVRDVDGKLLKNPTKWFNNPFERYIKANSHLVSSAESTKPTFTNPRMTDFWDTDKYTGTNPSNSTTLGLAEITNTNYLSDNTIPYNNPSTEHSYPFPKVDPQDYSICIDNEMETTDPRKYICRNDSSNPSGAISLINEESSITNDNISTFKLVIDDNIHDSYARELLPLAIGYSSSLLNYFFRGQMEVKCLPVIKENKISYVKLTIINATLGEAMTNGKLMLTGKYVDSNNEEKIIRATYGASDYAVIALLEYGKPLDLSFLFPEGTQIPVDKWASVKLTLTYQGKLGSEEGAVIGKVFDPGKLSFNEEFNTAPKGDYNWFQMDTPVFGTNICPYHNMEHGVAQNDIVGGKLIKTNIRYPIANPSGLYPGAHFNTSLIGVHNLSGNTYANNIFPIPVTKDTYIEFKIDDMTISPNTAASGSYTHYQGMVLSFNNGYNLEFSLNNQYWYVNNTTGYFTFNAGYTILSNIHKMFEQYNLPVPADFKLNYIGLFQQIGPDLPLDTQYEQKMIVDFVRIVDMSNM